MAVYEFFGSVRQVATWQVRADSREQAEALWREATGDNAFLRERISDMRDAEFRFSLPPSAVTPSGRGEAHDVTSDAVRAAARTRDFRSTHDGMTEVDANGWRF